MNEKTRELIAVGVSAGMHCQPCLEYHVKKAREFGLAEDEIMEAIAVGQMVEKGAMAAMRQFSAGIFNTNKPAGSSCCSGGTSGKKGGC